MSAVVAAFCSPVQPPGLCRTPGVCPGRLPLVEAGQTFDGVNVPVAASLGRVPAQRHAARLAPPPLSFKAKKEKKMENCGERAPFLDLSISLLLVTRFFDSFPPVTYRSSSLLFSSLFDWFITISSLYSPFPCFITFYTTIIFTACIKKKRQDSLCFRNSSSFPFPYNPVLSWGSWCAFDSSSAFSQCWSHKNFEKRRRITNILRCLCAAAVAKKKKQ